MKHQAGLSRLFCEIKPEWTLTENVKKNKIGCLIEKNPRFYPYGLEKIISFDIERFDSQ